MSTRLSILCATLSCAAASSLGCYADAQALVGAKSSDTGTEDESESSSESSTETSSGEPIVDLPDDPAPTPAPYCQIAEGEVDGPLPCELEPPSDQLDPVIAWVWSGSGNEDSVPTTPLVGNLDDDNGDGFIDLCDTPDIVVAAVALPIDKTGVWPPGHLHVINGESGDSRVLSTPIDAAVNPALGDLDGDGVADLVAAQAEASNSPYNLTPRRLVALRADGSTLWASEDWYDSRGGGAIALADLDLDGSPEILAPTHVAHANGETFWAPSNPAPAYSMPIAVDLDAGDPNQGDPELEVLFGATAYSHTGVKRFDIPMVPQDRGSLAIANFDDDDSPELYVQHGGAHAIFEHDGTLKDLCPTGNQVAGTNGHPVTIHDIDGDGSAELVFGFESRLYVLGIEADECVMKWSRKTDTTAGLASGTIFDLLGDGSADMIYADRSHLQIFDGLGTLRFQTNVSARESIANPIVADVDGDGAAEIVVVSSRPVGATNPTTPTVMVFENADDHFAPSRRVWNQHTYHHSNIREDGRVPVMEEPHWQSDNGFRSNRQGNEQLLCIPPALPDQSG